MMDIKVKKKNYIKCGSKIKFLSIISLVCTVLSAFQLFFFYDYVLDSSNSSETWWWEKQHIWKFTWGGVESIDFISILSIVQVVLFVEYIFSFRKQLKNTVFIPIIFGIEGFKVIFSMYFLRRFFIYDYSFYYFYLLFLSCILVFIILTIVSFFNERINNKGCIAIVTSLGLVTGILILFTRIPYYFETTQYLYLFIYPLEVLGSIFLHVSLFLFVRKNKIPKIISVYIKRKPFESMPAEEALRYLKNKFELGMISEEDYQLQRNDVIRKLM